MGIGESLLRAKVLAVVFLPRGAIGCVSIFWGREVPEVHLDSCVPDSCHPSARLTVQADALEPAGIIYPKFAICAVLGLCRRAQILPSVIHLVPVFMINMVLRPFVRHVEPRKTMGEVSHSLVSNDEVPGLGQMTSGLSNLTVVYSAQRILSRLPSKLAGLRAIVKDIAESDRSNSLAHAPFVSLSLHQSMVMP